MKKADHQSWHWKHSSISTDLDYSPSSRHSDDQDTHRIPVDVTTSEVSTMQPQISEDILKCVNEKLSKALLDISIKDDLVKQHAKAAEEAATGWKKAEAEAMLLKEQLDAAVQQRLATQDRVSHLDKALRECMQQLRHVREEQEQKIHEAIIKKTRDWEELQCELEAKLEDAHRQISEAESKNKIMAKSPQVLSPVSETQTKYQAENAALLVQVEKMEEENSGLKQEIQVLKKDLELESQRSKKIEDSAKKASKSELERRRMHTHKKQLSPSDETKEKHEGSTSSSRKKHMIKGNGSLRPSSDSMQEFALINGGNKELLDRLHAMDKETLALKQQLDGKNSELKDARLMYAKAISKLSVAEEQLRTVSSLKGLPRKGSVNGLDRHVEVLTSSVSREQSLASKSEDGTDENMGGSESWASTLVTELTHIKKEKDSSTKKKNIDMSSLDLMDDFLEMEQLLSNASSQAELKEQIGGVIATAGRDSRSENSFDIYQESDTRNREVKTREENLTFVHSEKEVNESVLAFLRESLDIILEAQDEGADIRSTLLELKSVIKGDPQCSIDRLKASVTKLSRRRAYDGLSISSLQASEYSNQTGNMLSSKESSSEEDNSSGTESSKVSSAGLQIVSSVNKMVCLIREFSNAIIATSPHLLESPLESDMNLSIVVQKFAALSDKYFQKKVHTARFVRELSFVVGRVTSIASSILGEALCNGNQSSRVCNCGDLKLKDELRKVEAEREVSVLRLQEEAFRLIALEAELEKVKVEKQGLEDELGSCRDQLCDAESSLADLHLLNQKLSTILASKKELEIQLEASEGEMTHLHEKVEDLEEGLMREQQKCKETEAKCEYYQQKLQERARMHCPRCVAGEEELRRKKEREIALAVEKLAECQQTMQMFGKQLTELLSPDISTQAYINSPPFDSFHETFQTNVLSADGMSKAGMVGSNVCMSEEEEEEEEEEEGESMSNSDERRIEEDPHCSFQNKKAIEKADSICREFEGRQGLKRFGAEMGSHEDYIEAVAEMPSSPEVEPSQLQSHSLTELLLARNKRGETVALEKHRSSSLGKFFSRP